MHVAGQNLERAPQVSHVESPPQDGVDQGTTDHVSAGPGGQLGVEGTHPRLHPGHPLRRVRRGGVDDVVHRRQRRPQRPAARPQHPRHQSRQCENRRITFTHRAPTPAVRVPQSRPARAVSSTIVPPEGRRRPGQQPTSRDHHALVSRQSAGTCEGLPRPGARITMAPGLGVSVAMCRWPGLSERSVAATRQSSARSRHRPLRCCSRPRAAHGPQPDRRLDEFIARVLPVPILHPGWSDGSSGTASAFSMGIRVPSGSTSRSGTLTSRTPLPYRAVTSAASTLAGSLTTRASDP